MAYPVPPRLKDARMHIRVTGVDDMNGTAYGLFHAMCEEWLGGVTWEQLLEYSQDLVIQYGEFDENEFGVQLPDCPNSVFPFELLKKALYQEGLKNLFAVTYGNKAGYVLINKDGMYACYLSFKPKNEQPASWYWELIQHDRVIAAGLEETRDWAIEACYWNYQLMAEEPFEEEE